METRDAAWETRNHFVVCGVRKIWNKNRTLACRVAVRIPKVTLVPSYPPQSYRTPVDYQVLQCHVHSGKLERLYIPIHNAARYPSVPYVSRSTWPCNLKRRRKKKEKRKHSPTAIVGQQPESKDEKCQILHCMERGSHPRMQGASSCSCYPRSTYWSTNISVAVLLSKQLSISTPNTSSAKVSWKRVPHRYLL
jgi:hypothetical protein